jgi:signal peptidase I
MTWDFATIMFVAALVTGGIWAMDAVLWAPKRRQELARGGTAGGGNEDKGVETAAPEEYREPILVEYARAFFPVILVVLLLRSFLVEPFRIPSGSMMPTLLNGDFILVNKFAYGIRLPVINKKIIAVDNPERGDVIVFRFPNNPSIDYIKRVVGLPGDRIMYRDKVVYVNGQPMKQELQGSYLGEGTALSMTGASLRTEHLANVEHEILVNSNRPSLDGQFQVPPGHYFVMGDNRDNSNDSRFWGTVPDENLVGKAFFIWMNWDGVMNTVRWNRIGSSID